MLWRLITITMTNAKGQGSSWDAHEKVDIKLISDGPEKYFYIALFFLPTGSVINGHCHKHRPKKEGWSFSGFFPHHPSCNWAPNLVLGHLLLTFIRTGRILQEWIVQTVLLQFLEIQHLSGMLLLSFSYTRETILTQRSSYSWKQVLYDVELTVV